MKNGVWTFITAVVVTLILSGSAIFIGFQYSQTQKDIADSQAKAMKESASEIRQGLGGIGKGICQTSDRQFVLCGN
jgi:preprotein translocase subunit SecY